MPGPSLRMFQSQTVSPELVKRCSERCVPSRRDTCSLLMPRSTRARFSGASAFHCRSTMPPWSTCTIRQVQPLGWVEYSSVVVPSSLLQRRVGSPRAASASASVV